MSIVVNQVEHDAIAKRDAIAKGLLGASKKSRRAAGAAKAHLMIAGKYEGAIKGRPGAVTAAAGTRFKSSTALRRNRLNEIRGENAGNASFHRERAASLSKAAHRRDESTVTATYGNRAEINQHARNGGVRTAGSSTPIHIGNQRTLGGTGAAQRATHRALVGAVRTRKVPVKQLAVTGGLVAGLAAERRHAKGKQDSVAKSAFGVELGKALGDDNTVRGGVSTTYTPPKAAVVPPKLQKIKSALAPAKSAMLAAAKK